MLTPVPARPLHVLARVPLLCAAPAISSGRIYEPSIVFDSRGIVPFVAFAEEQNEEGVGARSRASVYKFTGSGPNNGWEAVGATRFGPPAQYLKLQLDAADRPWVAFAQGGGMSATLKATGEAKRGCPWKGLSQQKRAD